MKNKFGIKTKENTLSRVDCTPYSFLNDDPTPVQVVGSFLATMSGKDRKTMT